MLEVIDLSRRVRRHRRARRPLVHRRAGPAVRLRRAQRRRQDDHDADHPRRARARRRRGALARPAGRPRRRAPRFGYMPEERGLYPKMRVRDQLAYFASLHGLPRAARRRGRRRAGSSGSGSPSAPATASSRSRSATSSASSSARRSCTTRSCSCSTSRSPASTRSASTCSAACCASSPTSGVPVVFSSHQLELVERLCEAVAIVKRRPARGLGPRRGAARARRERRDASGSRSRAAATELARAACPAPRSSTAGRDGVLVALRDGAGPDARARRRARGRHASRTSRSSGRR